MQPRFSRYFWHCISVKRVKRRNVTQHGYGYKRECEREREREGVARKDESRMAEPHFQNFHIYARCDVYGKPGVACATQTTMSFLSLLNKSLNDSWCDSRLTKHFQTRGICKHIHMDIRRMREYIRSLFLVSFVICNFTVWWFANN